MTSLWNVFVKVPLFIVKWSRKTYLRIVDTVFAINVSKFFFYKENFDLVIFNTSRSWVSLLDLYLTKESEASITLQVWHNKSKSEIRIADPVSQCILNPRGSSGFWLHFQSHNVLDGRWFCLPVNSFGLTGIKRLDLYL